MTISSDRVSDGVVLTARAEQTLDKILDMTARSTSSIAEIARATDEQSRGSKAATAAIEEVTKMVQQTASATQQQSQTARKVGEQTSMVRDYTKHLKRAMSEQETGSRAISRAMENIMGLVQNVLESTSVLATESSAIVKSMGVIQQATRESNVSIGDLNQMANTLSQESSLLNSELDRFTLPTPSEGGKLTTSTVLWQRLTLDPVHIGAAALGYMSKTIHAHLVMYGEGGELTPGLAERWETLEQGHVYRFYLRRGVRFHNGRTLEAKDVHDSLVRLLLPELNSPSSWIMREVRGAADVIEGRTRTLSGIQVRDQHTVDIILDEPLAFFLSLLTMHEAAIIPAEEARDPEQFRLHPVGAGPFRLAEAIEGERVLVQRNRDYFIPGIPHLDEIEFRLDLRSFRDVTEAFLRGEVDVAHGVPLKIVSDLRADPRIAPYMLATIQLHTSYFGYDCSAPPFNRVEVRQAVNHAINRDRINERVFAGLGLVAKSLLPPGLLGYDPNLPGIAYDPDEARSLMRKAGHSGGLRVEYRTWDTDEFNNSGQLPMIIEDLAAIGIDVNVTRHSAVEARKPLFKPGHGLVYCANWYADFPDSDNFFYVVFHSEAHSASGIYFQSAAIDAQIVEARRSNDSERRAEIYQQLNQMVVREAPLATLFHERFFVLQKPEVRGLRTSVLPPPVRYHETWIEE
jgi:peptide/nickel transport system substrate-binding protein/oligopeptide transport system substrate-binding protein